MRENAFTLIEIIVVLIILGVLAAIALPSYFNMVERANAAEAMADLKNCKDQVDACIAAKNDVVFCAGSDYSTRCSSEKFVVGVSPFSGASTTHYFITALRHAAAGTGVPISNDPGGVLRCQFSDGTFFSAMSADGLSGFILCHDSNGTVTIKGWGFYQGM